MSDHFYRAFEDKHRGSRDLIKARLSAYLPFVEPLLKIYPQAQAMDLGCGRGEWLELLRESGFQVRGVDLDAGMLEACKPLNLKTELMDALTALKQLPDQTQAVVSGFHLAEHIPFEALLTLVQEAQRVLVPAGLLILETPNPENLIVGTSSFYLDPTHVKPIPPLLLTFIPEFVGGYSKIKTIGLQEPVDLATRSLPLIDVFRGVSPDYALIAQKQASKEIEDAVSDAFFVERGVTLPSIAAQYDGHIHQKIKSLEQKTDEAALAAKRAEEALVAIYTSSSWRMTLPVRWMGHQRSLLREHGLLARLKSMLNKMISMVLPKSRSQVQSVPTHTPNPSYLALSQSSVQAKKVLHALQVEIKRNPSRTNTPAQ
jgi:O-antigen chain-terminating methyltransferase